MSDGAGAYIARCPFCKEVKDAVDARYPTLVSQQSIGWAARGWDREFTAERCIQVTVGPCECEKKNSGVA